MYQRLLVIVISIALLTGSAFGTTATRKKRRRIARNPVVAAKVHRVSYTPTITTPPRLVTTRRTAARRRIVASAWASPTFADSTQGDSVDGEDLMVRRAAVQALGPHNGAVIVADPTTGRILSVVNQKLAYQGAYEPCSTIKIVAALAGLSEGVINQETSRCVSRSAIPWTSPKRSRIRTTPIFASVGEKLGYDKIVQYGQMFGLGEKAGLNIDAEQPGLIADAPPSDGLGMMTSFGEGFSMTPMELTGIVSAVANGGTLYYLQHPASQAEIDQFVPQVKRQLDMTPVADGHQAGHDGSRGIWHSAPRRLQRQRTDFR